MLCLERAPFTNLRRHFASGQQADFLVGQLTDLVTLLRAIRDGLRGSRICLTDTQQFTLCPSLADLPAAEALLLEWREELAVRQGRAERVRQQQRAAYVDGLLHGPPGAYWLAQVQCGDIAAIIGAAEFQSARARLAAGMETHTDLPWLALGRAVTWLRKESTGV